MINSIKTRTPILALILFVFGIGNVFAADKVVVIPMGGDVSAKEFNQQHMWSGTVNADGTKRQTGLYTVENTSAGTYKVTLNVTGFEAPPEYVIPTVSIYFGVGGDSIRISGRGRTVKSGIMTSADFGVNTYNSSHIKENKTFFFHARFPEPDATATAGAAQSERYNSDNCTTERETVTCYDR